VLGRGGTNILTRTHEYRGKGARAATGLVTVAAGAGRVPLEPGRQHCLAARIRTDRRCAKSAMAFQESSLAYNVMYDVMAMAMALPLSLVRLSTRDLSCR